MQQKGHLLLQNPLEYTVIAVDVSRQGRTEVPCGYEKFWPARMLRIRMTGD